MFLSARQERKFPVGLYFVGVSFFIFLARPQDHRAPSADRREILPHGQNIGAVCNLDFSKTRMQYKVE